MFFGETKLQQNQCKMAFLVSLFTARLVFLMDQFVAAAGFEQF